VKQTRQIAFDAVHIGLRILW